MSVKIQDPKFTPMQGLLEGILPIFPSRFAIQVPIPSMPSDRQKCISIRRWQLQCCAEFAITDYRSQGRTFSDIILDIESPTKIAGGHHAYPAVYVALSRCWSLQGLSFLRAFLQAALFIKPNAALKDEMSRLEQLDRNTSLVDYKELLHGRWVGFGMDDMMKYK